MLSRAVSVVITMHRLAPSTQRCWCSRHRAVARPVTGPFRIVSECMLQLRMLGIADDAFELTAQRLSRIAVLCCLHVVMLLADDPRRPLQASVQHILPSTMYGSTSTSSPCDANLHARASRQTQ